MMVHTALAIAQAAQANPVPDTALRWLPFLERAGAPALALFCLALIAACIYLWRSRENWIQFAFKQQVEFQVALDKIRLEQLADSKKAFEVLEKSSAAGLEMASLIAEGPPRRRRS